MIYCQPVIYRTASSAVRLLLDKMNQQLLTNQRWEFNTNNETTAYKFGHVRDVGTGVSIRVQKELWVRMNGDEGLEVSMILDEVHDALHFLLRVWWRSMVGFRAWVVAGTRACTEHAGIWVSKINIYHNIKGLCSYQQIQNSSFCWGQRLDRWNQGLQNESYATCGSKI